MDIEARMGASYSAEIELLEAEEPETITISGRPFDNLSLRRLGTFMVVWA